MFFEKWKTAAGLRSGILAGLLAGCAFALTPAQADVTVHFWHSFGGGSGKAIDQIIQNFEKQNPGIHIEAEHVGNYNDIVAKLQAAIPAHRAPDAVIMEVTRYGVFADRGVLKDLTPYLQKDPLRNNLYGFAREIGVYKGKTYIVPFNSSTPVLYYNRELLQRAGFVTVPPLHTYADILKVAQQVSARLGGQGISGIAAPGQFARWALIMDNNSELIDPKTGKILIDAPNTIDAYRWMASLVYKYQVASPDGVTKEDNGRDAFLAGKVALMINSTGNYGQSRSALGSALGVLPMPCNKVCSVPIGGAGIGILSTADKAVQDAAYRFISYAASAPANALWFSATGYMPINRQTVALPQARDALAHQPGIDVAIKQLDFAHGRPRPVVVTWMRAKEYSMWQAMALGQRDVTATLKDFASQTREEAGRLGR